MRDAHRVILITRADRTTILPFPAMRRNASTAGGEARFYAPKRTRCRSSTERRWGRRSRIRASHARSPARSQKRTNKLSGFLACARVRCNSGFRPVEWEKEPQIEWINRAHLDIIAYEYPREYDNLCDKKNQSELVEKERIALHRSFFLLVHEPE